MSTSLPPVGADRPSPTPALQPAVSAPALQPAPVERSRSPADRFNPSEQTQARPGAVNQMQATREQIEQALSEVNQRMQSNGRNLAFSLDDKADRLVIKVTNAKTGEVVRQIPDETILRIAQSLEELKGALYDESA